MPHKRLVSPLAYLLAFLMLALLSTGLARSNGAVPDRTTQTFTVDSTADEVDESPGNSICATSSGRCTLRAAIQEANARDGHDTIIVGSGVYTLTIPGRDEDRAATGDLDITDDLTIAGAMSDTTIIHGAGFDRVLHFIAGSASISDVTIRGGGTITEGGGIRNHGVLTITQSLISHNGYNISEGGGIWNSGRLLLSDSRVSLNGTSSEESGTRGGGIWNGGVMTVTRSTIAENDAFGESGGAGGGIFSSGILVLLDSSVHRNSTGGTFSDGNAGGVFNSGVMTMTRSSVTDNGSSGFSHGYAGGIQNSGTLLIADSTIRGNQVFGSHRGDGPGGGIWNTSVLTITRSTISHNFAGAVGGGIANDAYSASYTPTLSIINSTISDNKASEGAGVYNRGIAAIWNVTISGNTAGRYGSNDEKPSVGGGIANDGSARLGFTIVAGNTADMAPDAGGTFVSGGRNLIRSTRGYTLTGVLTGNLSGVDPLLGPLGNNGGPTETHALLKGSPAIDAGSPGSCIDNGGHIVATDQRGSPRPLDANGDGTAACDIGAYEANGAEPAPTAIPVRPYLYLPLLRRQ